MAYNFNGTNQYLDTASTPVTAAPLTMACWFRASSTTTNTRLIGIYQAGATHMYDLIAAGALSGDPVALVANQDPLTQRIDTTAGYSANTWHHACGVVSSATSRTIYLDGANSATGTASITPSNLNVISIGRRTDGSFGLMNGLIAEVGIWNADLTAAEVASLADGMTCDKVRPQSLVFYAPLVRNLQDVRGGLTITNNNTATVANHPRVYA
jgi:hypothetical protein